LVSSRTINGTTNVDRPESGYSDLTSIRTALHKLHKTRNTNRVIGNPQKYQSWQILLPISESVLVTLMTLSHTKSLRRPRRLIVTALRRRLHLIRRNRVPEPPPPPAPVGTVGRINSVCRHRGTRLQMSTKRQMRCAMQASKNT